MAVRQRDSVLNKFLFTISMKQTLKQITPPFLWNIARTTNDSIRRLPELPAAYLHPWRRESIRRLAALKDIHKGKLAFTAHSTQVLFQK